MTVRILPGKPYPLGAHYDGSGTNFALFSAHAEAVELCLFDASGMEETHRLKLPTFQDDIFCGYVPDLQPGSLYGYRCHGVYDPNNGYRFNPHKLLLDPYARKLSGDLTFHEHHLDYDHTKPQGSWVMCKDDSASVMPKCVVTMEDTDLPVFSSSKGLDEKIIYEMHVKGYSKLNPAINENSRGTYRAIASDESIAYLKSLGITTIELLPVHASCSEPFLRDRDLTNYWGYNNYHFFVLEPDYAELSALGELRYVTQRMHQADIEVILDVVYNHTAEGGAGGPSYSFRGIDNLSYYALNERNPAEYWNHTGCGNSLNLNHPRVLQMVTDSLRYLVNKVGVDGFRFDLATTLGRQKDTRYSPHHAFFSCLKQDPVLSRVHLISEPWDIGMGGYQLGHFPHDWLEWNDKFRDVVRTFWRGDVGSAPEFARRMHGSGDIFSSRGRSPYASVNFISAHDGFTLRDVVSYENKHNLANKEDNRDGHSHNCSANYGVEGPTNDPKINQIRLQQSKNILASLLLAQGTPMLLAGDEFGNSQQGNNNAYCQDNEISWLDWSAIKQYQELIEFCQFLIKLRSRHPLINRPHLAHGLTVSMRTGLTDISWLTTQGKPMTDNDWQSKQLYCFAMMLAATQNFESTDGTGSICSLDDAILLIFNSGTHPMGFTFPEREGYWKLEFNTAESLTITKKQQLIETKSIDIAPRSCVMCSYVYKSE